MYTKQRSGWDGPFKWGLFFLHLFLAHYFCKLSPLDNLLQIWMIEAALIPGLYTFSPDFFSLISWIPDMENHSKETGSMWTEAGSIKLGKWFQELDSAGFSFVLLFIQHQWRHFKSLNFEDLRMFSELVWECLGMKWLITFLHVFCSWFRRLVAC